MSYDADEKVYLAYLQALVDLRGHQSLAYKRVQHELGYSYSAVRGMVSRARNSEVKPTTDAEWAAFGKRQALERDAANAMMYRERDAALDDTPRFLAWLDGVKKTRPFLRVLISSDWQLPDVDPQAMEMLVKVHNGINPDLHILQGDIFDFDAFSSYAQQRGRTPRGALGEVDEMYAHYIRRMGGVKLFLPGNHDGTIDSGRPGRQLAADGKPYAEVWEPAYVDMIRQDGLVWNVEDRQEIKLFSLFVQHGKRTGENAAKTALKKDIRGMSQSSAHNHTPAVYYELQERPGDSPRNWAIVTSATNGAHCARPEHYKSDTDLTNHMPACQFWNVSLHNWVANLQMIMYHRDPNDTLHAFWGDRHWQQSLIETGRVLTYDFTYRDGEQAA
jgi:hypothetical protein